MSETLTERPDRTPRHDGWTPEREARFLDSLAEKGNVRLACRQAGMSPEAAYRLKRREPAFARGWAAALVLAHDSGVQTLADRAIDGIEEDVWHRGEVVGTRRRYDTRLLLAHLARLDKALEDKAAQADAARFDELVAVIVGGYVPDDLLGEDDPLMPLDREHAAVQAGIEAEEALRQDLAEAEAEADDLEGDEATTEDDYLEAYRDGLRDGEARWDGWVANACAYVDHLTGRDAEPLLPGVPGNLPLEPLRRALAEAAARPCESPAKSHPWTLSDTSTSALAYGLAGPPRTAAATPQSPSAGRDAPGR